MNERIKFIVRSKGDGLKERKNNHIMILKWLNINCLNNLFSKLISKSQLILSTFIERFLNRQEIDIEEYQKFLKEALQATVEKNYDSAVISRILQQHREKLNNIFAQLLKEYAKKAFFQNKAENAVVIAESIQNLCIEIQRFTEGNIAHKLEIAIIGHQLVLKVYTREAFPEQWARSQNALGAAYTGRIKGNRAENIELAIAALQQSSEVCTREATPFEWSSQQHNMGIAYNNRIKGERAENIELAIYFCQQSLEVCTCETMPFQWATLQTNLGDIYNNRIKGEKAENLKLAIAACKKSLKVYTFKTFPEQWAEAQNNLGNAYAILAYVEEKNKKREYLELAIKAFQKSLKVHTREAFPEQWANIQNNLGSAYRNRIRGKKTKNLKLGIIALQQSLKVYTREAFPEQWARSKYNLGICYLDLNQVSQAIEAVRLSLEIWTPTVSPFYCLEAGQSLGTIASSIKDWETAIEGYHIAIEAIETSRNWAATPQRKQEIMEAAIDVYMNIVQACIDNNQLSLALEYVERSKNRNLVELLANYELYPKGDIDPFIVAKFDSLRRAIHDEQLRLDKEEAIYSSSVQNLESNQPQIGIDKTYLNQLQHQLNELIDTKITPIDSTFSLTQKVESILYTEIQLLIDQNSAILEFYITSKKIIVFIIYSKKIALWESSSEGLEAFQVWIDEYLNTYYKNKNQWIATLAYQLEALSNILQIDDIVKQIPNTVQQLIIIPHRFFHILPLHALPLKNSKSNNHTLQDRFTKGINYNPSCQLLKQLKKRQRIKFNALFAIQNPTEDLLFADLEIASIQQHFNTKNILSKQNATKSNLNQKALEKTNCFHFSCHGYFNINNPFQSALILANTETKITVSDHSKEEDFLFKNRKPVNSSECLTLEDIFKLDLPLCRLVTLSACETGLTDTKSLSDEYVGLPSGFLFSGSLCVVSSLWVVDDFATTFLMIKFYENLISTGNFQENSITLALQNAQYWLKNLTPEKGEEFLLKIETFIDILYPNKPRKAKSFKNGAKKRVKEYGNYPFANPFYWAAFTVTGL